jgi:Transposase DDE domain.
MHDALREKVRVAAGREPTPSAGSIDSQSVKSARTAWIRGFDARKKINGIKRHIVVDTLGLLLLVVVHSSAVQDRDRATIKRDSRFCRVAGWWNEHLVDELPSVEQESRILAGNERSGGQNRDDSHHAPKTRLITTPALRNN